MRLRDYFERIGWSGVTAPTLDTLGALLRAHNHKVPFENLDVQLGNLLTTEVEDAYDKIVNGRRGGWCYEQNGLFGWALSQIGFDVRRIAATVMRAHRGPAAHANHLTLLVGLPNDDVRWLVDAGFGGSMLKPIRLHEETHDHAPFTIGLRQLDDGYWQFWESLGEEEFSFDFENAPADEQAMAVRCHYLQTSPESGFVQNLVCQLRRPDAHVVLRGRVFSVVTKEGKRKRLLDSGDELVATLRDEFKLIVPEAAGLWGKICERHEQFSAQNQIPDP
ncbi:MAG: arylamine N-acetyltransferase [Pseudomonadota bacterium]